MATIDDVAKAAGVSKSTVSSVFSKKRPISKEVTAEVLKVAKELNYRPNYWARSLVNKNDAHHRPQYEGRRKGEAEPIPVFAA